MVFPQVDCNLVKGEVNDACGTYYFEWSLVLSVSLWFPFGFPLISLWCPFGFPAGLPVNPASNVAPRKTTNARSVGFLLGTQPVLRGYIAKISLPPPNCVGFDRVGWRSPRFKPRSVFSPSPCFHPPLSATPQFGL